MNFAIQKSGIYKASEQSHTLSARDYKDATDLIVGGGADMSEPILLESNQNHATIQTDGVSTALPAAMGEGGGYVPMVTEPVMMSDRKGHNGITEDGTATTLTAQEKDRPIVAAVDCRNGTESTEVNGTLQAKEQGQNLNSNNVCRTAATVRRLTPKECERLQGFPDDWSRYGINEKGETFELSDSARYKLQGNSIARPFWAWLLRRIGAEYVTQPTLGSLFDGQGGFMLCGLEAGIKPIWASEIEKNAVAVTKKHFGDAESGIKGDVSDYLWG